MTLSGRRASAEAVWSRPSLHAVAPTHEAWTRPGASAEPACSRPLPLCPCPSCGQTSLRTPQTGPSPRLGHWEEEGLPGSISASEAPAAPGCGVTLGDELATGEQGRGLLSSPASTAVPSRTDPS